jgi:hypothetical protein
VVELLATSCLESKDRVSVTVTGCKFCSASDCGSGGCGAGGVAVEAMEVVCPFKHSEVFKKLNLYLQLSAVEIVVEVLEAGGSKRGMKFSLQFSIIFFSGVYPRFFIRSEFSLSLSTEFVATHLL